MAGFTGRVHHLDARVGGTYRMSFTSFTAGPSHSFGGTCTALTPPRRIRCTDPGLPARYFHFHANSGRIVELPHHLLVHPDAPVTCSVARKESLMHSDASPC